MSEVPWHKHYHADALNSMANLSVDLRGVYYTLLDMIYDARGPLACSDQMFAARMCCSVRKWKSYRDALIGMGKIYLTNDGKITNKRAEKELKISRKRAENGAKGGRARAENSEKAKENSASYEIGFKQTPKPQKPEPELDISIMSSSKEESIIDADAAKVSSDKDFIWSTGVDLLVRNGSKLNAAKSLIGRFVKDAGGGATGEARVASAVMAAVKAGSGNPGPYIAAILKKPPPQQASTQSDGIPKTRIEASPDGKTLRLVSIEDGRIIKELEAA